MEPQNYCRTSKIRDVPFAARVHHPHRPEPTIVEVMLFFVVELA
jgi:hypothetical protein